MTERRNNGKTRRMQPRSAFRTIGVPAVALCVFLSFGASVPGQVDRPFESPPRPQTTSDPNRLPENGTIRYRRWLAPTERIEDWPFGEGRYVPLRRELFEDWAAQLEDLDSRQGAETETYLARTFLQARLEGRQLVDGRGFFDIPKQSTASPDEKRKGEANFAQAIPRSISLDPLGLWIGSPRSDNGTDVSIARTSEGKARLFFFERAAPAPDRQPETASLHRDGETSPTSDSTRIHFQWSLRSRTDSQGRMLFDLSLPPCTAVELDLELPASLAPSVSAGLVLKEPPEAATAPDVQTARQRWRILLGRHAEATLTIVPDERSDAAQQKTAFRQTLVYSILPRGTEVVSKFYFDKEDARINDLFLDLEAPLRTVEIRYGENAIPWSVFSRQEDASTTRIRVDLADIAKTETRELTVVALLPILEKRDWNLPRIRAVSPNLFWKETRCGVVVQNPLQLRKIACDRAVQVSPVSALDRSNREVYAFQFFDDDAQISLNLDELVPTVDLNSSVQIRWGANEVSGNMVLDCGLARGERYSLEFPIAPRWTIDSVKSVFGDDILSWDIVEESRPEGVPDSDRPRATAGRRTPRVRLLSIQLKRPLRSLQALRIQIGGRYLAVTRRDFRLTDVAPLILPRRKSESHFVAIRLDIAYRLQYASPVPASLEIRDPLDSRLSRRFIDLPMGTVLPLNSQTENIRFTMERLRPSYTADISGTVRVHEKDCEATFRIVCRPADSSVDRVYVGFSPSGASAEAVEKVPDAGGSELREPGDSSDGHRDRRESRPSWTWNSSSELFQPIQARLLNPTEWADLTAPAGSRNDAEETYPDEIWEIRLAVPQTLPFEIRAVATIPLSDTTSVPLASVPLASSQKGEIRLESTRFMPYRIVNSRLKSLPVPPGAWDGFQETRAAFRYDPDEEFRQRLAASLLLKRISPDSVPPTAWVWLLRMDTQYESEGIVRNNAVFFVENRGKDSLRITLPEGVGIGDVHAVWLGDSRVTWHPDLGENAAKTESSSDYDPKRRRDPAVVVSLPEEKRFVSVSVEYSFRDVPLTEHRKLNPRYPVADVPVLSGNWTAWFPPEFDVSTRRRQIRDDQTQRRHGSSISRAMSVGLGERRFDLFSPDAWRRLLQGTRRRRQARNAADAFFRWIERNRAESERHRTGSENMFLSETFDLSRTEEERRSGTETATTWGDVFADEKTLADMTDRTNRDGFRSPPGSRSGRRNDPSAKPRVWIDRQSLAYIGIAPATPVAMPESSRTGNRGMETFDRNGLLLFVSEGSGTDGDDRYTFYVTTFLTAAAHHHFNAVPIGNGARYLDGASPFFDRAAAGTANEPDDRFPASNPATSRWISAEDWIEKTPHSVFPWSMSSQVIRLASVTPDWIAYEMPQGFGESLYIVHRHTFTAYCWLAFLAVVVLTWRRPFSHPVFLLILLVLFELMTRWAVPCHAGVPAGAFLGACVALGFTLIRSRRATEPAFRKKPPLPSQRDRSPDSGPIHLPISAQELSDFDLAGNDATPPGSDEPDHPADAPEPDRGTGQGPKTLLTLFFAAVLGLVVADAAVADPLPADPGASRHPVAPAPWEKTITERREPYRVFFPVDGFRQITGNVVWVPEEFFRILYRNTRLLDRKRSHHWSIVRAEYQGSMVHNPLTQSLDVADFKAVFDIVLEEETATVALPPMPLRADGARWNGTSIQPTWHVPKSAAEDGSDPFSKNNALLFVLENEKKGKHRLELLLEPKPVRSGENRRVAFAVPKIPDSVLRLTVPTDAPAIVVSECLGAVMPNTAASPILVAQIGSSGNLAFSWGDEPRRSEQAKVDVEPMFWLRARPTQIDLRTKFRYRIDGGKVRHLNIASDPHWQLSGQYHCEEFPIDQVETYYETTGTDGAFSPQREVTRLVFKTPVSGALTIRAGFVLKGFSGIGKVRLPRIRPLHAGILRPMLAVSADPLLELELPTVGLGAGFEAGWTATSGPPPGAATDGAVASETAGSPIFAPVPVPEERPLAEYDLTQTDPSWTLAVRTGETKPALKLIQAIRFDYGDSTLLGTGTFSASGEVFQQAFSVPESFQIESIEARDWRNGSVDLRWSETDVMATNTGEKRRQGTIFFKRPVSGSYRIVVLGHFPTETTPPRRSGTTRHPDRTNVPLLMFDNVLLQEQQLDFFRMSSVMAEVRAPSADWMPAELAPLVPKPFADSFGLGSWKRFRDEKNADAAQRAGFDSPPGIPTFTLRPNRPLIRGTTIISLTRDPEDASWQATFDLLWDIAHGELESLRFRWDERCGSMPSVEPAIPWTLEQIGGESRLVLAPKAPLSGKQHFRIKTSLHFAGTTISIPRIDSILDKAESIDAETYLILPGHAEGESIPWSLVQAAEVDEPTMKRLTQETEKPLSGEISGDHAASDASRLFLKALGEDFGAEIARKSSRVVASLYDLNLLVRRSGELFGVATVDLKTQGQDSLSLTLPHGFELIRIESAGMASEGTRLTDRRWRLDLWAGDYPQRIGFLFRGTVTCRAPDAAFEREPRLPFAAKRLAGERLEASIPFPVLENIDIQETLWTVSLETLEGEVFPPLTVSSIREGAPESSDSGEASRLRDVEEPLGRHVPVHGLNAITNLLKIDLVRLNNLLSVLDSVPSPTPAKASEFRRWLTHWIDEWTGLVGVVELRTSRHPNALYSGERLTLLDSRLPRAAPSAVRPVGTFVETMETPELSLQALFVRQQRQLKHLDATLPGPVGRPPFFSRNSLVHWRMVMTEHASDLFGTADGAVKEIRLLSNPGPYRWSNRMLYRALPWLAIPAVLLLLRRRLHLTEIFLQFPHYWGIVVGLLLGSLFSSGIGGFLVIVLVLLSFFRPVWRRPRASSEV